MPWQQTCVMQERVKFITDVLDGTYSMTDLCIYYGISRKTGYKWLDRHLQGGFEALANRSRAPHNHPNEISPEVKNSILEVKSRFPKWGSAKIRYRLERIHPAWNSYPAISTIGLFLRKQGLSCPRKRRRKATATEPPLTKGCYSNQVWSADFKGHFRTGDNSRYNPLTISDYASRYLLCCQHLDRMSYKLVRRRFERVFRQYGLSEVIRTDNGSPFASCGLGGLSRLSCWWIRLGIYPERIAPGHPEQNGRHERIHKTLKSYTALPAAQTLLQQQKRFDAFGEEYNEHRPHEALDMHTPSERYSCSSRTFPSRLAQFSYGDHMQVRRVYVHGDITYRGRRLFLSESLRGENVGLEEVSEDTSLLWYCDYLLGRLDHRRWRVEAVRSEAFSSAASCGAKGPNPEKVLPMCSV